MADVNISKYRASVVRDGSKPASPGFVVSEGQDPVNPPGTNNFVPYTGATANVELGEFGVEAGFVTLDTTPTNIPTDQGAIYWDDARSTAALIMNGTLQHIGQDSFFYVKNSSGSTIPKGTCVGFAGTDGGSGHLLITPFLANGSVPSTYFMGVTSEEIANGSFGQVMHFGELTGINTSGFTAGDLLYASSTVAGAFQTTAPVAPNNIILVAAAVNSKNNGAIVVRPTLGSNINTDEGVKITSPTTGDLLQLQAGGLWENKTLAQVIGSAYVPSNRTITINGTTQDLSANRTFNVGTVTSVGLSSATSGVTIGSTPVTSSGTITLAIATASGSQNGLLSSTDWTTFNNKQNALTNPVTGTGTTNRLAKFTGASTIGNSNISDGGITILNENPVAGQFAWQFNGNTTTGQSFGASVVAGTNSSDIAFRVLNASASTTHLLVKGDGNLIVGGTTDNGARLQVSGTMTVGSITGDRCFIGQVPTYGPDYTQFSHISRAGANQYSFLSGNAGDTYVNSVNAQPIYFRHNNVNLAIITSGGNLLVGTTSDNGARLQVSGNQTLTGRLLINSTDTTKTPLLLNAEGNFASSGNMTSGFAITNTSFGRALNMGVFESGAYAWMQAAYVNNADTTFALTLQPRGGNLLVGTTTDNGARLQVSGNITVAGSVRAANTGFGETGGFIINFRDNAASRSWRLGNDLDAFGDFSIQQSTTQIGSTYSTRLYINTSGSVGIGTTSPLTKLHADSTSLDGIYLSSFQTTSGGVDTGPVLYFGLNDGVNNRDAGQIKVLKENGTSGNYSTYMSFFTRPNGSSSNERMRISSNGNVGIGTSSPGVKLEVSGGTEILRLRTNNSDNYFTFFNSSGSQVGDIGYDSRDTNILSIWNGVGGILFGANASERMRITSSGNVLIGTATDNGQRLQVSGGASTALRLDANSGVPALNIGAGATISVDAPGVGGGRFLLNSSGNVLIGTTTDNGAKLQVNGDILTSAPSGGTAGKWKLGTATSGSYTIGGKIRIEINGVAYDILTT